MDMEVDLHLPLEVDMKPDQPREDVLAYSGAVDLVDLSHEEQRRFEPPNGAQSKWLRHELPLPIIMEPRSPVPVATAHVLGPGAGRHRLGVADLTYPGLAQRRQNAGIKTPTRVEFGMIPGFPGPVGQLPRVRTQFKPNPYKDRS